MLSVWTCLFIGNLTVIMRSMSIPKHFTSSQQYFENCVQFLSKYSWIYESSNTRFVGANVLEKFPAEWVGYFTKISLNDLNAFPDRKLNTNIFSLNQFLKDINKLQLTQSYEYTYNSCTNYKFKKMNLKKQHEVTMLSGLIKKVSANEIDIFVDVGSGLGYLTEVLYRLRPCKIIGLEAESRRVQTSIERLKAIHPDSVNNVTFKKHFVTSESVNFIESELRKSHQEYENAKLAIIGLHACADLTISAMKLFIKMENVKKLIVMPCCYHKLELNEHTEQYRFTNFPLSDALKKAAATFKGFNRPFLRLACQETSSRWKQLTEEEHYLHGVEMFLRSAVEAILEDNEYVVKSKLKISRRELKLSDWIHVYELRSKITKLTMPWRSEHTARFADLLLKYPFGSQLSEALTCLQTTIQKLCENVVLYDRICYIEEQAMKNNVSILVGLEKIINDSLSPRCSALIAQKL